VRFEHLARDLCIAGLVGPDEAELISSEGWYKAVEKDKKRYGEE